MTEMEGVVVPVVSAWQIGGGYAHTLDCADEACCPYPGIPAVITSEAAENLLPRSEVTPTERVESFGQGEADPAFVAEVAATETSLEEGLTKVLTGAGPKALIATAAADLATGCREVFSDPATISGGGRHHRRSTQLATH